MQNKVDFLYLNCLLPEESKAVRSGVSQISHLARGSLLCSGVVGGGYRSCSRKVSMPELDRMSHIQEREDLHHINKQPAIPSLGSTFRKSASQIYPSVMLEDLSSACP